jgi:predicted nucleic acid-binding protein
MNGRFFLDTNVFVYAFDAKMPTKANKAARLIRNAVDTGNGVISYQVVQEFFNVAFRRFTQPMTTAEAEQYLTTVLRPLLAIHSSPALFLGALQIGAKHRLNWYDSIIVAAALEARCETLYSEDFHDGHKIEDLSVRNPFA